MYKALSMRCLTAEAEARCTFKKALLSRIALDIQRYHVKILLKNFFQF